MTLTDTVEIQLMGQAIKLRSEGGEKYIRDLAAYVEGILTKTQNKSSSFASRDRIAVMAALHIADEYMQLKKQVEGQKEMTQNKLEELIQASDRLLARI